MNDLLFGIFMGFIMGVSVTVIFAALMYVPEIPELPEKPPWTWEIGRDESDDEEKGKRT